MAIDRETFREPLGTYFNKMQPLFANGEMDRIFSKLKSRSREGYKILPESANLFRCFQETPYEKLTCVMCALAPYHTMRDKTPVADGLLMSCANTGILAPSLIQYYNGIENEFGKGLDLKMNRNPDLTFLAHQGVLMYNISLTTEIGKKSGHLDLWKTFSIFLFEEIISLTGVPVIFLGKEAWRFKRYLAPMQWNFCIEHPAAASYSEGKWDTKGSFKQINKVLKDMNGIEINWAERHE